MSVIAEITIPLEALPGEHVFESLPHAEIELERVVPTDESALPFFWVWDGDGRSFLEIAEQEPDIQDITQLKAVQDGALYSANWQPDINIVEALKGYEIAILEGNGTADGWFLRLRAKNRDDVADFQQSFAEYGIHVQLLKIYDVKGQSSSGYLDLTPKQRKTLIIAFKEGYYEEPRGITQEELGTILDISSRAVSHRLRRGTRQLIKASLTYTM